MRIEHLAIWVKDLDGMKDFYATYFHAVPGERYHNPKKNFTSYFLRFAKGGPRLELMHRPDIAFRQNENQELMGITHFAISVGSRDKVDTLTDRLRDSGFEVAGEPRTTGDGCYESVVLDPENNRIEITE